jgi:nardilysin
MANDAEGTVLVGPDLNASRSPLDKKLYRHITLPNGLQAVLIQDTIAMQQLAQSGGGDEADESDEDDDVHPGDVPSTERPPRNHGPRKSVNDDDDDVENGNDGDEEDDGNDCDNVVRNAACCIVVGAGSVSDPPHCPGLAHFLEHLLFMGSIKYPGENDYPSYVAKHGGSDPAWTEWEYTAYSFDVTASSYALWGALDRLAQFFVAPLLPSIASCNRLKPSFNCKRIKIQHGANISYAPCVDRTIPLPSFRGAVCVPFPKFLPFWAWT